MLYQLSYTPAAPVPLKGDAPNYKRRAPRYSNPPVFC